MIGIKQTTAGQVSRRVLAWRFAIYLVCALLLTACSLVERLPSDRGEATVTSTTSGGGSPTPAGATPVGQATQINAGPQMLPVDDLGTASRIFWSAGSSGIAVAGDNGLAVVQPAQPDPQPQGATPALPPVVDATGPALLTGAQNAPVLGWVSEDTHVYTLDAAGAPVQQAESDTPITGLAVSPDGDQVAYATFDGRLTVAPRGDTLNAQAAQTWETQGWLTNLSFSPDETLIGGTDLPNFTVYLLDAGTGQVQRTLEWVDSPVQSLYFAIFSPDWSRVAWVAQTAVQVMDAATGEAGVLLNHEDHVSTAAWSPDGGRLATAAAATVDGNLVPAVLVWDVVSGERVFTLPQPAAATSLAFSPDGSQVAVLDSTGNLQVWSLGR